MKRFVMLGFIFALSATASRSQTAPTPDTQVNQIEGASISGRVIINGSAAPSGFKVALVENLRFPNAKIFATAETDSSGYYVFKKVQPREYSLKPATGHAYVNRNPQGPPLGVAAPVYRNGNLDHVDLDLVSAASISGRVTGPDGRPVAHQEIYLDAPTGRGRFYPPFIITSFVNVDPEVQRVYDVWKSLGPIFTDDEGIYRIDGLTSGRYIVSAGEDIANMNGEVVMRGGVPEGDSGRVQTNPYYPMTFHPGVTDISKAMVIEVSTGGHADGVDIRLGPPLRAYHLRGGTIEAETGKPVANCSMRLSHEGKQGRIEGLLQDIHSDEEGKFDIDGLIGNTYHLLVSGGNTSDFYSEDFRFVIRDSDINGVEVKLVSGKTLSGSLVVEGDAPKDVTAKIGRIKLSAWQSELEVSRVATVAPDGSFRISGLASGRVQIALSNYGSPDLYPFSIVGIEHPFATSHDSIEIGSENLTGARIVLKFVTANVRGKVKVIGPPLPAGLKLEASYWLHPSGGGGQTSSTGVKSDGSFEFTGLPPGECRIMLTYGESARKRAAPDQTVIVPSTGSVDVVFELDSRMISNR